jgi:hypothetical protein
MEEDKLKYNLHTRRDGEDDDIDSVMLLAGDI